MAQSGTEEKTGEKLIRLSVLDMDCPVEEGEIQRHQLYCRGYRAPDTGGQNRVGVRRGYSCRTRSGRSSRANPSGLS